MKSIRPGIINTILICLLLLCQLAYGQSGATATKNYILSYSPRDSVSSIDQISDISRRGAS
ncbi:MAG: hypothetical protein K0B37_18245, partial [Bacteroidales bacterium]|nr:hypothetical protein [Bacteroidales bacterium]